MNNNNNNNNNQSNVLEIYVAVLPNLLTVFMPYGSSLGNSSHSPNLPTLYTGLMPEETWFKIGVTLKQKV